MPEYDITGRKIPEEEWRRANTGTTYNPDDPYRTKIVGERGTGYGMTAEQMLGSVAASGWLPGQKEAELEKLAMAIAGRKELEGARMRQAAAGATPESRASMVAQQQNRLNKLYQKAYTELIRAGYSRQYSAILAKLQVDQQKKKEDNWLESITKLGGKLGVAYLLGGTPAVKTALSNEIFGSDILGAGERQKPGGYTMFDDAAKENEALYQDIFNPPTR